MSLRRTSGTSGSRRPGRVEHATAAGHDARLELACDLGVELGDRLQGARDCLANRDPCPLSIVDERARRSVQPGYPAQLLDQLVHLQACSTCALEVGTEVGIVDLRA